MFQDYRCGQQFLLTQLQLFEYCWFTDLTVFHSFLLRIWLQHVDPWHCSKIRFLFIFQSAYHLFCFFFVLVKSKSLFRRHSFLAWNFELDRHFDWNVLSAKKLFSFFPLTHLAVLLLCTSLLPLCASYASWNATFGDTGGRVYAVLNCNVFRPNQRIGTKKKKQIGFLGLSVAKSIFRSSIQSSCFKNAYDSW